MLDFTKLNENNLREILATVETPGYKFLITALEGELEANLERLSIKRDSDGDLAELNHWRGLKTVYNLLTNVQQMATQKYEAAQKEKESQYTGVSGQLAIPFEENNDPRDIFGNVYKYQSPYSRHSSTLWDFTS